MRGSVTCHESPSPQYQGAPAHLMLSFSLYNIIIYIKQKLRRKGINFFLKFITIKLIPNMRVNKN